MRLVVTGGSSFVGAWFCLAARDEHEVVAVYAKTPVRLQGVTSAHIDLGDPRAASQLAALRPDVVVHAACKVKGTGDGRSETPSTRLNRRMMDAVLAQGAPVLYASSTCVHWPQTSGYARGRRDDELRLRDYGVPWAVVRPCAPYGPRVPGHQPSHKESFHTLAELVRRSPAVPVIGNGRFLRQPIHVDDLSQAMLGLVRRGLPGAAFDAGGREALSFRDIVKTCARHLGVRRAILPIPKRLLLTVMRASPDFEPDLLETSDCDDVADPHSLAEATGRLPRSFAAGVGDLFR